MGLTTVLQGRASGSIRRIVSGGQTGVDRGALDAAIALGVAHGGWCPRGRLAEDGCVPERYRLRETASEDYAVRTERNVVDADATLILTVGRPSGGTALTRELAARHDRPCLVVDLAAEPDPSDAVRWLVRHRVRVLNVAGPRESAQPGLQARAAAYVHAVLVAARAGARAP